jgi:hypothetical protein
MKMVNHPNRPTAAQIAARHRAHADIYVTAFEAGFGFCNYAHNLGMDPPETAEEKAELAQQEQDRENYRASLKIVGRRPGLPLGYPFTLSRLGFEPE